MQFEWDDTKNRSNLRKHGVSFEVGALIFEDPSVVTFPERIEDGEERWHSIGLVRGVALILIAHTIRDADGEEIVRIISARPGRAREKRMYEEGEDH